MKSKATISIAPPAQPQTPEEGQKAVYTENAILRYCRTALILAISLLTASCARSQPTPTGNGPTMAANELAAISQLRAIASAESTYQATTEGGTYGTLKQLVDSQAINSNISSGENRGYRFEVKATSGSSFEATATPKEYGFTGLKSFYMNSTDSQVHAADKKGAEAIASDPAL